MQEQRCQRSQLARGHTWHQNSKTGFQKTQNPALIATLLESSSITCSPMGGCLRLKNTATNHSTFEGTLKPRCISSMSYSTVQSWQLQPSGTIMPVSCCRRWTE